ncbi:MAG: RloB domain-containing protein [Chlorobi bacterium]|nr:RloB domain-containing protein [Chlorobiota bacterium]
MPLIRSADGKLRNDNKQVIRFQAVPSIPSFELWLLLHFENVQSQIDRHEVLRRLKKHISQYEKGYIGTFNMTHEHLGLALSRAEKLGQHNSAYTHPEPYTAVGTLVQLLTGLRA